MADLHDGEQGICAQLGAPIMRVNLTEQGGATLAQSAGQRLDILVVMRDNFVYQLGKFFHTLSSLPPSIILYQIIYHPIVK